jgi:hypothetical protein
MGLLKIDKSKLVEEKVKTTPQNVKEANEALFCATMNLPTAAKHCGMTQKEMKLTFWEFLKYHPCDYESEELPSINKGGNTDTYEVKKISIRT